MNPQKQHLRINSQTILDAGNRLMDEGADLLISGNVEKAMIHVIAGLKSIRTDYSDNDWLAFSKTDFLEHPLTQLLHQDPFTRHSFEKPRGYAGDADLLDYIYELRQPLEGTTLLGEAIFKYMMAKTTATKSVRARRDIMAATIDKIVAQTSYPAQILSVACGHLRESFKSQAIQSGEIGRLIAFDQDALSLAAIDNQLPYDFVETVQGSVSSIIRQSQRFNNLDLVYSAGLYDYLSQPLATRLTKLLFDMLSPGGTLIVANFVPNHNAVGYMETFMQWDLICRTQAQMEAVSSEILPAEIATRKSFIEEDENVVFLEIVKV